jgi:hypothetical protein
MSNQGSIEGAPMTNEILAEIKESAKVYEAIAQALWELGEEKLADLCFTDMAMECEARAKTQRAIFQDYDRRL